MPTKLLGSFKYSHFEIPRYEYLDSDIILPTCDQDGKLLMADVPVKAAPIQILNMAFSNHHNPRVPHSLEQGKVQHTFN